MGFVIGLLSGLLVGVAGAVLYSVQTGRDLRQEFEQIRREVDQRDFDALGKHLEERFKELQTSLEERFASSREEAPAQPAEAASASAEAGTWATGEATAGTAEWGNRSAGAVE